MPPVESSPIRITVAPDSRHSSSLEWCSYGPTKTTASAPGRSIRTNLSIAPVEPDPVKMTTVSSSPPIARRMMSRASSRTRDVRRPVADASVCVFAYQGSISSRMKSSTKDSDRPEAVWSA